MSDFIKGIVKLAKEYRASEQDARFSQHYAKIITADYAYDEFKDFISNYKIGGTEKLITYLSEYGFEKVAGSGYVIHHFDNTGITHYIEGGKTKQEYQIYRDILQRKKHDPKMLSELTKQIQHIVLLPAWFHNYIKHVPQAKNFTQRQQFYELMKSVLLTNQAYEEIKALKFDGSSVVTALKSIRNLSLINNETSDDIIKALRKLYKNIQNNLIDHLTN